MTPIYGPFLSRKQALEQGLKHCFTRKPCKKGHISPKRVGGGCWECRGMFQPVSIHTCEQCSVQFYPENNGTRFCSHKCNANFNNNLKSAEIAKRNAEQELLNQWLPGYMPRAKAKELGLKTYFVGTRCKNGHVAPHLVPGGCTICALQYAREWRKADREANLELYKAREAARPKRPRTDEIREKEANSRERRRPEIRAYMQTYEKERKAVDACYAIRRLLAGRLGTALKKQSAEKAYKTMELIGCTVAELKAHLESKFEDWMTWENRARNTWHVDHIRPCMSFDLEDPAQQKACFYWANMQPLEAAANIRKSDTWTPEMEAGWAQFMRNNGYEGDLFLMFDQAAAA